MAIQSRGLASDLFPKQILATYAGAGSVFAASVAAGGGGLGPFPSCKLSPARPISTKRLSAAFSAQCSLSPTSSLLGARGQSFVGRGGISPVHMDAQRTGKRFHRFHGNLAVGKRNFRQLLLITPSLPAESGIGSSFSCSLALPTSRFEFQGRRVRSVLYRILKLSTPFSLSWSLRRRRCVNLRVSRAAESGMHCVPIYSRWLSFLNKSYVVTSSRASFMEFNHVVSNQLYRGFKGFESSSHGIGYFKAVRSLRSQAEGHGIPQKVMLAEEEKPNDQQMWSSGERKTEFLAVGYGWRVRDAALNNLQELMQVADIQTDAFHTPAAAFDDLFYKLFHAEVLSSLQYKARHSPRDRYSCLLAEKDPSQPGYIEDLLNDENEQVVVGVVDVTALVESNILALLPGAYEYLYVSGMAVDAAYRRRCVATLLLEACVARASEWGFKYLVLHAYEDDVGARTLYSRAGFRTVGGDPMWMTKFLGRRRRVVMARSVPVADEVAEKYP
ncbi:hypothetical protein R1flu_014465 [Riccia fluitans]|uniref:N-acetyltransferase domain-containing protein n=1 Tax=Riccia fluitans TaxID=41844 RepID=A0ABD1YG66_9MARC